MLMNIGTATLIKSKYFGVEVGSDIAGGKGVFKKRPPLTTPSTLWVLFQFYLSIHIPVRNIGV